jgi:NADPH:quinone reductase-like Zn-dependent oxidoreductase
MTTMTRAYAITAEAVAAEAQRTGESPEDIDVSNVVQLDDLELRDLGPRDVRLKILAVSAEHNITHAATADTINIAEARGGKIYPGNSAVGEVTEVGPEVTAFTPGDVVITHCNGDPDRFGFPLRIWAYDMPDSIGW